MKKINGKLNANGIRITIIKARENSFLSDQLLKGAEESYRMLGGLDKDLTIVNINSNANFCHVIKATKDVDVIVCLGAISPDGDRSYLNALNILVSCHDIPVVLGLADGNCLEDVVNKCGVKSGNIGAMAIEQAVELANVLKQLN